MGTIYNHIALDWTVYFFNIKMQISSEPKSAMLLLLLLDSTG